MVDANPTARPFPVVAGAQHAQKILQAYLSNHAHETYPFVVNTEAADLAGALYTMLEMQNSQPAQPELDLTKAPVSGEMVELAVEKAGASFIPLRECGICHGGVGYHVQPDGRLWFDSGCECACGGGGYYCGYERLADIVNEQMSVEARNSLRAKFHLPPEASHA